MELLQSDAEEDLLKVVARVKETMLIRERRGMNVNLSRPVQTGSGKSRHGSGKSKCQSDSQ